jgi:hypothetical protein
MYEVEAERKTVIDAEMERQGIKHYTMQKGNGEYIWVQHGRVNAYYLVRDGKILDVWID